MQARSSALTNAADGPVGIPEDFNEHMTVTYDLLHIAFQGDISRVFSFMLGHEGSGRSYAHVGVKEPHHSTSHHKNTPESIEQYARIGGVPHGQARPSSWRSSRRRRTATARCSTAR